MGSRGQSSASGRKASPKPQAGGIASLDAKKIERANVASALGTAGDAVNRKYQSNVKEISGMNLSKSDKSKAVMTQKSLSEKSLDTIASNPSWSTTGRGNINAGKAISGADKISKSYSSIESHMQSLRKQSTANGKQQNQQKAASAIQKALKNGDMSVVINGKTYTRKSKRSQTFSLVG